MKLHKTLLVATALTGAMASLAASAQTKWDLASAYPTTNFHTENLTQFAADVDKATAGKLKITVHANASLIKAPEIKRAVQGQQVAAGEVLLVNFENENPLYGLDGIPFLASSYADSKKLYDASKSALDATLGKQGMMLLYTVPWPPQGIYSKKPLAKGDDLKGSKWRAYSPATARIAELVGAWKAANPRELVPQLRRGNRIRTIQASLAIEQNTLSLEQVTAVLDGKSVLGQPREIQEVLNAFAAYEALPHWQAHALNDLLTAHGLLLRGLAEDAGQLRRGSVGIYQDGKLVHMAPPASQVPRLADNLLHWLASLAPSSVATGSGGA